jgi:hypothetical protein
LSRHLVTQIAGDDPVDPKRSDSSGLDRDPSLETDGQLPSDPFGGGSIPGGSHQDRWPVRRCKNARFRKGFRQHEHLIGLDVVKVSQTGVRASQNVEHGEALGAIEGLGQVGQGVAAPNNRPSILDRA